MRELAEVVISVTGSKSRIEFKPLPQDDPKQRCPDIAKAQEVLRWQPQVALTDGLRRTAEYFDKLLTAGTDMGRR
jgi:UDP-glucuronate decarboxylase